MVNIATAPNSISRYIEMQTLGILPIFSQNVNNAFGFVYILHKIARLNTDRSFIPLTVTLGTVTINLDNHVLHIYKPSNELLLFK